MIPEPPPRDMGWVALLILAVAFGFGLRLLDRAADWLFTFLSAR